VAGLIALLLALSPLPAAAAAQEKERPPAVRSSVVVKGYPSPVVPQSERVDDSYFDDVLLVGDSLSSGIPHYKVMPALEVVYRIGLSPITVAEDGYVFFPNGKDKKGVKLTDFLAERNPRVLYLWLGLNGIEGNAASYILPYYHVMLNRLIEALPNTLIVLLEVTPVTKEAVKKKAALTNKNVDAFNAGLFELAREHNIYILQIHDGLLGKDGTVAKKFTASDGIHLSRAGYYEVVDYLYAHTLPLDLAIWPDGGEDSGR